MYAFDFEYDSQYLSNYGFVICNLTNSSGAKIVTAGSKITFKKISRNRGRQYSLTSTQYDECIQATFQICKNPCVYGYENMAINDAEYRNLMRWLNRKEFLKCQIFYKDDRESCYYNASFNIEKVEINGVLYGLQLTMETDKPYGYGQEQTNTYEFSSDSESYLLVDISDEIGSICPYVTITCNANGDLEIYNDLEECTTIIKNCKAGEIITLDGETQIIATTYNSHDICNDFNYEFFRIGNTFRTRNNHISVSIPCKLEIKYYPIIKNSP